MLKHLFRVLKSCLINIRSLLRACFNGTLKRKPIYHCLWYLFNHEAKKKSIFTITKEFCTLYMYWEDFPNPYFENAMFLTECKLSVAEMKKFLPQARFDKEVVKDSCYKYIIEDKALFSDLMGQYNLPQPRLVFKFCRGLFFDGHNKALSISEVDDLISHLTCDRVFLKDSVGAEGAGIHAFSKNSNAGYWEGSNVLSPTHIKLSYPGSQLILQEGVTQCSQLAIMNPSCLNTIRVLSRSRYGEVKILAAMLKLGRFGRLVDNVSQGAIMIQVDVDTGRLGSFARIPYVDEKLYFHPETKIRFEGVTIDRWDQVRELVTRTAHAFHRLQYVGWDVAITPLDVMIIEGNYNPGIIAHQIFGQGLSDEVVRSLQHD